MNNQRLTKVEPSQLGSKSNDSFQSTQDSNANQNRGFPHPGIKTEYIEKTQPAFPQPTQIQKTVQMSAIPETGQLQPEKSAKKIEILPITSVLPLSATPSASGVESLQISKKPSTMAEEEDLSKHFEENTKMFREPSTSISDRHHLPQREESFSMDPLKRGRSEMKGDTVKTIP